MLAALINRLAAHRAKELITCPGRGYRNRFSRWLQAIGFSLTTTPLAFSEDEKPPIIGRLLCYRRGNEQNPKSVQIPLQIFQHPHVATTVDGATQRVIQMHEAELFIQGNRGLHAGESIEVALRIALLAGIL